jgi:hypothetical protein
MVTLGERPVMAVLDPGGQAAGLLAPIAVSRQAA